MVNPAVALTMARARESEVRRQTEHSFVIGGEENGRRRSRRQRVGNNSTARRLLVSKVGDLIRLADSLDCRRDELIRMIQSQP